MQIAYYFTLTTHIQVVCPHWMVRCQLGHNSEK